MHFEMRGMFYGAVIMELINLLHPYGQSHLKKVEAEFKAVKTQINSYVLETGSGDWLCSAGEKSIIVEGKDLRSRPDLLQMIEVGLENGSCRARLPTAAKLDGAVPK